ncbi:acyltransferase [Veillonella denticariosi]|nr:acyltransferase [Veillonella denticariosi]
MKKAFLPEITYMRGLCMLGVIGIHVGSYALQNPFVNLQLIGVLEILSRFGVPAFFFLSAFGLFYHTSVEGPFSYKEFMHRRIQVVLFPYIVWSLFYLLYAAATSHNFANLHPGPLAVNMLFGTSMYHLYFMVILLWFYVMMPIWRAMVKVILKRPVLWLSVLLALQVGIDYVSSYMLGAWVTQHFGDRPAIKYLFDMRLNYWVIHYVWIFLLGAVCAERYDAVREYMWRYRYALAVGAVGSALLMLGAYYYVMDVWHYTVLEAIYTVHQMSPMGVLYTGLGTLFSLFLFQTVPLNATMEAFWSQIGDTSYGVYLVHPFWLLILSGLMAKYNLTYTVIHVIAMYIMALGLSYLTTLALDQLPKQVRRFVLGR